MRSPSLSSKTRIYKRILEEGKIYCRVYSNFIEDLREPTGKF